MAKRTVKTKQLTRRQVAKREKEARTQRILTLAAIGVGALIVIIIAVGAVTEVIRSRAPVARIGDTVISTQEFRARQYYQRWLTRLDMYQYINYMNQISLMAGEEDTTDLLQQLQFTVSSIESQLSPESAPLFARQVLDQMIEEELVRQEAAARGLTVSEEELTLAIERSLGYDRDALALTETMTETDTLTDTVMTEAQYREFYQQFKENVLQPSRFSEDDYRTLIKTDLLRQRLVEALGQGTDPLQEQVESIVLVLDSEESALAYQERLNSGELTPEAAIEELALDEQDQTYGFPMPWLPAGFLASQFGPDLERAAFETPVGQASEPVSVVSGTYYLIYVVGRELRPLGEELLAQGREQAYTLWLEEQRAARVEILNWEQAVLTQP